MFVICHLITGLRNTLKDVWSCSVEEPVPEIERFYKTFTCHGKCSLPIIKFLCFSGIKEFSHFPGALPEEKKKQNIGEK